MMKKAAQRAQRERGAALSIRALPERAVSGRLAPHFNLDVVVQFVGRVAVAVEANVTAFHALGIDQLALVGFDVIQVLARAETNSPLKSLLKMVVTPVLNVGSSETCTTTSR